MALSSLTGIKLCLSCDTKCANCDRFCYILLKQTPKWTILFLPRLIWLLIRVELTNYLKEFSHEFKDKQAD